MPALITPFTRSGALNLDAHAHNVALMWHLGVRGVLVAGSTGEGPYLEPGERHTLARIARESAPRSTIICGIHAETVRTAATAMDEAAQGRADAVLVATPTTLVRHRPDLIEGFFTHVLEAAPLPVLLYSVPKVTGVELGEASVTALSPNPQAIGMKDSGGDPVRASRLVAATPDDFVLYAGATAALNLSVTAGAHGAITASANYAPRLVRDTVLAAHRSPRSAAETQYELTRLSSAVERFGIPGVKYAAGRVGLSPGHSRLPLAPLDSGDRRAVREAISAAKLTLP